MNQPVGVLRVVDPFQAGEAWVPLSPPGYRVAVEPLPWPPRATDVARIAAAAAREGARIVHACGRWANVIGVPAARLVRAKAVCTDPGPLRLAEAVALQAADAIMCDSRQSRDRCVRKEGVPARKVCVVHPGVDVARFAPRAPDEKPLIAAVGGLFARNGYVDLLEAVARLRAEVPGLRVICAGEGPMRPVLEQRAAFHGLRDCVELPGHLADVSGLLSRAHAAWTPGLRATLEGMAAGVPVVSGWREVVPPECVTPRRDATALAERLLALLRDARLGPALRKRAEKEFSLEAFSARVAAMYGEVLASERAAA
ncbi:MAG TPA: glycosyltransferase [Myxococcales bacterium]|nr:glycosyltransferase [Myxococcales bacterium]